MSTTRKRTKILASILFEVMDCTADTSTNIEDIFAEHNLKQAIFSTLDQKGITLKQSEKQLRTTVDALKRLKRKKVDAV